MSFSEKVDVVLRSRVFLAIGLPLFLALVGMIVIVNTSSMTDFFTWEVFPLFGLTLLMGILSFPSMILLSLGVGMTYSELIRISLFVLFYALYLFYILKVKLITRKTLYIVTGVIILLSILGVRGCTLASYHM